jgi:hypothetical protein
LSDPLQIIGSISLIAGMAGGAPMPASDPHEEHGNATLSLAEQTADGGQVFQSWTICACTLGTLRKFLGPPEHESFATAEATSEIGAAVLRQPGSVQVR